MVTTVYTQNDVETVPFYGTELIAACPALRGRVEPREVYLFSEAKHRWVEAWKRANRLAGHKLIMSSWSDEEKRPQEWYAASQCSCGWHRSYNGTLFAGPMDPAPEFAAEKAWRSHIISIREAQADKAWGNFLARRA